MIRCGHCQLEHITVDDVKACAQREGIDTEGKTRQPSPRQLNYAHSLLRTRMIPAIHPIADLDTEEEQHEAINKMNWSEISSFIGTMVNAQMRR